MNKLRIGASLAVAVGLALAPAFALAGDAAKVRVDFAKCFPNPPSEAGGGWRQLFSRGYALSCLGSSPIASRTPRAVHSWDARRKPARFPRRCRRPSRNLP